MNEFRTIFEVPESKKKINYDSNVIFMGSCFSDNVGNKIKELKIPVEINPFGVLYNPVSIANSIDIIVSKRKFNDADLNFYNGKWFSFFHHSIFSDIDKLVCLNRINERIILAHEKLKEAAFIFITFGTSRVYSYNKTGDIVSNCHKLPAKEFTRKLLEVDEIVEEMKQMIKMIQAINPSIDIVFTLSPIRHWKDGAVGNMQSKARLLLAIDKITSSEKNCSYFPSYEIVMDDLRDYRFYADDMIHLSNSAVDYIFDKFFEVYIDETSSDLQRRIMKIERAKNHRPFNPESLDYKKFAESNLLEIESIIEKYPKIDLIEEKKYFASIIENFKE